MSKLSNQLFHGMKVISDQDCLTVRDSNVLEINSSGDLVCRYYNKNGSEEDDPFIIDIYAFGTNPSESNITGSIKRQLGTKKLLVSQNAVELIQSLASLG